MMHLINDVKFRSHYYKWADRRAICRYICAFAKLNKIFLILKIKLMSVPSYVVSAHLLNQCCSPQR